MSLGCLDRLAMHEEEKSLSNFSGAYSILALLPFDPTEKRREVGLYKELLEYQMVLSCAIEAINTFHNKDLEKFDSFVGENACQVRAFWIALLASQKLDFEEELVTLMQSRRRISALCDSMSPDAINIKWPTLHALLESQNLLTSISLELYFIIQCFVLTEVRLPRATGATISSLFCAVKSDPKKLKRFGDISSMFSEKLVRKYRKFVSSVSVQFIRQQAGLLGDQNLIDMVSPKVTLKYNDHLSCCPMFWTYQVILSAARQQKIPLVLHAKFLRKESFGYTVVDNEWVVFQAEDHSKSSRFMQKDVTEVGLDQPAVIVQGFVVLEDTHNLCKKTWGTKIQGYSIDTTILAGAADHPQYPHTESSTLESYLNEQGEYTLHKSLARKEGFSLDNPSTFFIRHVYASTIRSARSPCMMVLAKHS